jgi:dynein heavy chain
MLMPKPMGSAPVQLNQDPDNPAPFPPVLLLHIFDNHEWDIRTPEEWVEMGRSNGVRKPVPGFALLPAAEESTSPDGSLIFFKEH